MCGEMNESTYRAASLIELLHTATLVHDDINDHGITRRGRPTINARWGRTFALLTGDFLFTKVYELMAPYKDLNKRLADGWSFGLTVARGADPDSKARVGVWFRPAPGGD